MQVQPERFADAGPMVLFESIFREAMDKAGIVIPDDKMPVAAVRLVECEEKDGSVTLYSFPTDEYFLDVVEIFTSRVPWETRVKMLPPERN